MVQKNQKYTGALEQCWKSDLLPQKVNEQLKWKSGQQNQEVLSLTLQQFPVGSETV